MSNRTARDTEGKWPRIRSGGVYVSVAGYFCCEDCEVVLEPTGRKVNEQTWHPEIWECPECGEERRV